MAELGRMELYRPQMDGFEATRRLTETYPGTVVVLVSLEHVEDLADEVAACGAVASLQKRELLPATLRALWTGMAGIAEQPRACPITRASQSAANRAGRELSRYAEVMAADTVPCDAIAPFPARVRRPVG